jgi:hypothetical protein
MIPDSIVILPTCGNKEVHAAHSWRHGFLHLRKEICDGFTMLAWIAYNNEMKKRWEYLNKRKPQKFPGAIHKHKMFLSKSETTVTELAFVCDWTGLCDFKYTISRGLWNRQTIKGYRQRMARLSCASLFEEIHKGTWQ